MGGMKKRMDPKKIDTEEPQCINCIFILDCHPQYKKKDTYNKESNCPLATKGELHPTNKNTPEYM
jgi:hypothetical protein